MANQGFLSTSELDFDAYKENLKTFLKGQAIFKDYDFEGSNLSVLLDLLAYNTYQNAFYLQMIGSEMFLDTALLRESAVSRAKELNYIPRSRVSAKALVSLTVSNLGGNPPATITVPKNFYFSGSANGKTYLFSTAESTVIRNEGGSYTSGNIFIYEGRVTTEYFVANSTQRYVIASANVDSSSIEVNIQTSNTDTSNTTWARAYNLYGLSSTSNVYFLQGYASNQYEVVFGNGITGNSPAAGNIVKISYRDCLADEPNYLSRFSAVTALNTYTVSVSTVNTAVGGAERESLDSIKFNAPRHFSSQDRAITKSDYEILIRNNFPTIQAVSVFGGEELEEKKYGKVAVATKPYGAETTPDIIKTQIGTFLKDRTSVAIDPIFVDPEYFYVAINSTIRYDLTKTNKTTSDIETLVRAAITTYNNTYLYDFNNDFRYSKLTASIDGSDGSIVSNSTKVWMVKRYAPSLGTPTSISIKYNNAIHTEGIDYVRPFGHEPAFYSSDFIYNGQTAHYEDLGQGSISIFTASGTVLLADAGNIDYSSGLVNLTSIIIDNYSDHINLYAELADNDIVIGQNHILQIDQEDVDITVESAG